ncbi:MAG: NAD-dependent epimerase/dehydratase family protein [Chloroflexi bacterium]|nr:NAD-dependent epimerase/dehydratase family protein [Chloroflexota bacterium]
MRLIILGARGFVGSAIHRRLPDAIAPRHTDVDLNDARGLTELLRPDDVVINAAGYANATDRSEDGMRRLQRDNVDGVRVLAGVCAKAKVARLVHLSSVAAMGRREGVMLTEEDAGEPTSPYAVSKREGERVLQESDVMERTTILRPTSVFGPGRGLGATLCRICALPVVPLPAGGRALIPMTDVDTVASAVAEALAAQACAGRTFIVGDERSYSLRSIMTGLSRAMEKDPLMISVPTSALRGISRAEGVAARVMGRPPLLDSDRISTLTTSVSYSTAAFRDATGFHPAVPFDETIGRLARWYLDR